MRLVDRIAAGARQGERGGPGWDLLQSYFSYQGNLYGVLNQSMPGKKQEEIGADFQSLSQLAYKQDSIVFACIVVRMSLSSQIRFSYRALNKGRPGRYWSDASLAPLEEPWPGGTTGDLVMRAILDNDLAGNAFFVRRPISRGAFYIKRLRPDWVTIILGSPTDPDVESFDADAEVLGYQYQPGGPRSSRPMENYMRDEVCHFAHNPDPDASFRGMSWLTPVIREVMGDKAMTDHKIEFLEHGATPNLLVKVDPAVRNPDAFQSWVDKFKATHEGRGNQYKTLFLGAGSDATAIGTNFQQIDFKATQGAGETRIALAARVPPVILGASEGLQGSSLNEGNYQMAKRHLVDFTMRPMWHDLAGSLSVIVPPPSGSELWCDDRDVPALAEGIQDKAMEMKEKAMAANFLFMSGFDPDSIVLAIESGDFSLLTHTGVSSVQAQGAPTVPAPVTNGKPAVPA